MYRNASINVYAPIRGVNSQGKKQQTWSDTPVYSFTADVQSKTLSQEEAAKWGLSSASSGIHVIYCPYSEYLAINNRVSVSSKFSHDTKTYIIRGIDFWSKHERVILVPEQGV